jgi:hypothetical protein
LDDGGQTGCVKMLAWWGVCPCAPEAIFNSLAGDIQPFPSILHWQTRMARLERENKLLEQQVAGLFAAVAAVATDGETPNKTTERSLDGTVATALRHTHSSCAGSSHHILFDIVWTYLCFPHATRHDTTTPLRHTTTPRTTASYHTNDHDHHTSPHHIGFFSFYRCITFFFTSCMSTRPNSCSTLKH